VVGGVVGLEEGGGGGGGEGEEGLDVEGVHVGGVGGLELSQRVEEEEGVGERTEGEEWGVDVRVRCTHEE